jgi:diguanylate cyclase (GGDEF)-like protein
VQIVDKKDTAQILQPESIDLSLWREFQERLSGLLGISITLYDDRGSVLVPTSGETDLCKATKESKEGRERCRDLYLKAIPKAVERYQIHIFKCHANQYIFAIPVSLDKDITFVIVGRFDLKSSELKGFRDDSAVLEFDDITFHRLKNEMKTVPLGAFFTVPNIVKTLAVPFLKCIYSRGLCEKDLSYWRETKGRLKALHTLQEVCGSLAPVLDREDLYEAILKKSTELVGAEQGTLMILDNNVLAVKASRGIDRTIIENLELKIGESISGFIAKKGVPVVVKDIEKEIPSRKNRSRYKTKSFISIPLKMESRVIGVVNISDKITGEVFSEEDLHMLLSFANYATIALERESYYSLSEELKMVSMTDPLTGLFNRRYFLQRLYEEVERVKRLNEFFALFMIDIDNFKSFNDKYGHLAGDEILRGTSSAIKKGVRAIDVVARVGGEEFGVILPSTTKEDSFIIAERIRRYVESLRPPRQRFSIKEGVTISLGVAEFPQDAEDIEELIHNADRAMYLAKSKGKNRVVGYER